MTYRKSGDVMIVKGEIPKIFYWINSPYHGIFTVKEIFYATWMTWFHFRERKHWAQGIYLLTDKVEPSKMLPGRDKRDFNAMIEAIFNRVNEKEKELTALFQLEGVPRYYRVLDFSFQHNHFEITLGTEDHVDCHRY